MTVHCAREVSGRRDPPGRRTPHSTGNGPFTAYDPVIIDGDHLDPAALWCATRDARLQSAAALPEGLTG